MVYSKPMIDLIREIRRRVDADQKPSIKLANPDLLEELIPIYQQSKDNVFKALARELMQMAGETWVEKLQAPIVKESPGFITKMYRGQTRLEKAKTIEASELPSRKKKPKRMYRGMVVED